MCARIIRGDAETDHSNLHISPTRLLAAFITSFILASPFVVFPLSTLILKAAAPDEEDQSGPAPSTGHRLHPRDHGRTMILLISPRSISSTAVILCCTTETRTRRKDEEIPMCYVSLKEDFSQRNTSPQELGLFFFLLFV